MKESKSKNAVERQTTTKTSKCVNSVDENDPPANLAEAIRARFAPLGGLELELPPRGPMRDPPDFE